MFKIGSVLKQIRQELNYHQIDLYSGIMSKSVYIKVEADSRPISVEELSKFSERLGVNFFEILNRAGMNTKSVNETGKEKLLISKIFTNPDLFDKNFQRIEPKRLTSLQYFSIYL
ncbi:helix-turn-helix transcriptional regulator, partial [Enterococcus faecalis]|nr:helix-turn-helix transcriptional regulator [Enterococcus faecalis]EGO9000267.1 XRE family transcriptional regulator [Enterococcus faecalis]EGO9409149.1 XRE family transcriptional regulator [Enterococcus faecalis]EHB6415638.1 helix-turn-helix transcriptional regulator [Enterococcus faecalis]